jgi:hypothetical protein
MLGAGAGAYALTGPDVGLRVARTVAAAADSYVFAGVDAALIKSGGGDKTLVAGAGSYVFNGADAGLALDRLVTAGGGVYSMAGSDAGLMVSGGGTRPLPWQWLNTVGRMRMGM